MIAQILQLLGFIFIHIQICNSTQLWVT